MTRIAAALTVLLLLAGCSHHDEIPGPDVTGSTLPTAQKILKRHGIATSIHSNSLFGVLVPEHYVVCKETRVSDHMVRLDVSRYSC